MFDAQIRHAKETIRHTAGIALCGLAAMVAGLVALGMFTTALFIWVAQRTDTMTAALTIGAAFSALAGIAVIVALLLRKAPEDEPEQQPQQSAAAWLEPSMVAAGLDIARMVGGRRATSLVAGALAVYWLLNGRQTRR